MAIMTNNGACDIIGNVYRDKSCPTFLRVLWQAPRFSKGDMAIIEGCHIV